MTPTMLVPLLPSSPDAWAEPMAEAANTLRAGGIVAVSTDTVYGLAVDPFNEAALAALFAAKGRPEEKPIALLVADVEAVQRLTTSLPPAALPLIEAFWPGPLTLVMDASPALPAILLAGKKTVGIRMPDHSIALELLRQFGGPLAVTSANLSGEPDLCTADDVHAAMNGRITMILDGGRTPGGVPSTVVDLTATPPRVLREGPLSASDLARFL